MNQRVIEVDLKMSFENIITIAGCILFFVFPVFLGVKMAKGGIRERDVKHHCPYCGYPISRGAVKCPHCLSTFSGSDFFFTSESGAGFKLKGTRFGIGFIIGLVLEVALIIGLTTLFKKG